MKLKIFLAVIVIGFTVLGINSIVNRENKIEFQEVQLESKQTEIKQLKIDFEALTKKQDDLLKNHSKDKKQLEEIRKEKERLLERQRELERQLQAKREAKERSIASAEATIAQAVVPSVSASGSCEDWIAQAGITEVAMARELIRRESGCNPNAVNSSSGACGISQSLPCSKMGGVNSDGTSAVSPVQQIIWMQNYVMARYGSWQSAVNWHDTHNWY